MTQAELRQMFYSRLTRNYYQGELQALYHWCVQEIQHWSRVETYLHNNEEVSEESLSRWKDAIERLAEDEPVQYVFGTTIFFGLKLHCDPRALIPRPETEELVQIILDREPSDKMTVADIGTGSGCIALALKSNRPNWKVLGLDVSSDALALAKENAKEQKLDVSFNQVNIQDQVDLSGIEIETADDQRRAFILKEKLTHFISNNEEKYDYILIDCPPSLSLLTVMALVASHSLLVPLQTEFFALEGITQLIKTIERIKSNLNQSLEIRGILLTMYDKRNKLSSEVESEARKYFQDKVYKTVIPRNVRLSEAPSHGVPVLIYDKTCPGSKSYYNFTDEFLDQENNMENVA